MSTRHHSEEVRTINAGGHTVERLTFDDAYRYVCIDCAGHADDLDAYRADDCDGGTEGAN